MKRFGDPENDIAPCGRISGRAGLLLLFRPERDRRRRQLHHALSPTNKSYNTAGENFGSRLLLFVRNRPEHRHADSATLRALRQSNGSDKVKPDPV